MRRLWLKLHLYLALSVGFLFALMGLTGSYNAFMHELESVWDPALSVEHPGTAYRSLEEIMAAVRKVRPDSGEPWFLQMPRDEHGLLSASQSLGQGEFGMYYNAWLVEVNPYTAAVVRSRDRRDTVMGWIFDLHCSLLLGSSGQKVVGILGLCLLSSVLTGLVLWWPSPSRLLQALTIKRYASPQRFVFDLHKVFGIYSGLVLTVIAFSGVYLIYSDYVRPVVNVVSPVSIDPFADLEGLQSRGAEGARRLSPDEAVTIARSRFPKAQLRQVRIPEKRGDIYTIRFYQPGEANRYWPSTAVYIDQFSGAVLGVRDPNQFTAGETFLNVQYPLHNGEALGLPGRLLVCIVGFVPSVLYITGLIRWLQKRRAQRRAVARHELHATRG